MKWENEYYNEGCNGGYMELAFEYLAFNSAIYEHDYPYVSGKSPDVEFPCQEDWINAPNIYVSLDEDANPQIYHTVNGTIEELIHAIHQSPTAVSIDANSKMIEFYSSGIINDEQLEDKCYNGDLNHGVTAIGIGYELSLIHIWRCRRAI